MINEIDAPELASRLQADTDLMVMDIRSHGELAQGMLPGAVHLPMHLIPLRVQEFPRDRELVLYCHSGARSYHACLYLAQQGYPKVAHLRGGILDWANRGFQLKPHLAS